jgi:lysophospholipase L1-like esterase
MSSALSAESDYADPLHPDDQGYQKLASIWNEAVNIVNSFGWLD